MKKLLTLLILATLFVSCSSDDDNEVYSYIIKNNTQFQITEVVVYYYIADVNARCNGRELSIKNIDADNSSKIIETNYPYVSFFYSYNGTNSFYRFPVSDNHYKLDADKLNTISIDDSSSNNFKHLSISP